MAISIIEAVTFNANGATSFSPTLAGPIAANDVLVLAVGGLISVGQLNMTNSGWTLLASQNVQGNSNYTERLYWRLCTGSESASIGAFTTTIASNLAGVLYRITGARVTAPLGTELASATRSGAVMLAGPAVSTAAGRAIGVMAGTFTGAADSVAGWTLRKQQVLPAGYVVVIDNPVGVANSVLQGEANYDASGKTTNSGGVLAVVADASWQDSALYIKPSDAASMSKRLPPKDPDEVWALDFDLADLMQSGESVQTWVVTVTQGGSGLVLGGTQIKSGNTRYKQWVSVGVDGLTYHVSALATTTSGRKLEAELVVPVVAR